MDNDADIVYSHTGHDVINYFLAEVVAKKTVKNAASDGFGSNLSGSAFCLPHQMAGFLFPFSNADGILK